MRPKDWKNPYRPSKFVSGGPDWQKERAYEAGADAMLEALRKNEITVPDFIHFRTYGKKEGRVVLIPNE